MWIIILMGIIMLRECKHAERAYNYRRRIADLEYQIREQINNNNMEIERW